LESVPGEIKETAKSALKMNVGSVTLEPLLLNARDSITLKILLAQTPLTKEVRVNGRIVGINQILNLNKVANPRRLLGRVWWPTLSGSPALSVILNQRAKRTEMECLPGSSSRIFEERIS
jgi:hypothetical protein